MSKMPRNPFILNTISSYISAYYPILYVFSFEEDRVESYLEEICRQNSLNLYLWDIIEGFFKVEESNLSKVKTGDVDYADYMNCLSFIEDAPEKSVMILKDYHPAFTLESSDLIVRKLRNVIVKIRDQAKVIVLVIPPNCEKSAIPKEIEKEAVIYRFPVPDLNEGKAILNQVIVISLSGELKVLTDENGKEKIVKAALGLTTNEMESAFIRSFLMTGNISLDNVKTIHEEKKQIIEKTGILQYYPTDIHMTEIGGLEELKFWLEQNRNMFDEKALEAGCDTPKGILFIGVPGCGKSLTAKGLASFWKMPLLRFDLSAVFGGLVGESEANMRRALESAESIAPCVLWVDEIEKGLAGMTAANSGDSGTSQRVFGTLISWMQEREAPVFFVATANDISRISNSAPELLRSGRFDEIFFIDLPAEDEREQIFSIHLKKRKGNIGEIDLKKLANLTKGFSGSDIEQVVKDAKRNSFISGAALEQSVIEYAIAERLPMAVTMKEKIESLREWAELHARYASKKANEETIQSITDYEKKRPPRRII